MKKTRTPLAKIKLYRRRRKSNSETCIASDFGHPYPTYDVEDLTEAVEEVKETIDRLSDHAQRGLFDKRGDEPRRQRALKRHLKKLERISRDAIGECHQIYFEICTQSAYVKKHFVELQVKAKVSGAGANGVTSPGHLPQMRRKIRSLGLPNTNKPAVSGLAKYDREVLQINVEAVTSWLGELHRYCFEVFDFDADCDDHLASHDVYLCLLQEWERGLIGLFERLYQLIFEIRAQRGQLA